MIPKYDKLETSGDVICSEPVDDNPQTRALWDFPTFNGSLVISRLFARGLFYYHRRRRHRVLSLWSLLPYFEALWTRNYLN